MIIAALVAPFVLLQAGAPAVAPAPANECAALIDTDPVRAYEEGMARAALTQELAAYRCAAESLAAQNRHAEAARRFESLAEATSSETPALRAQLLAQAGNAWLADRNPAQALTVFARAMTTIETAPDLRHTELPDLLIDRGRAYALQGEWRRTEEDLSRALDLRPQDPLALRLRAYARMQQNAFDLAEADAQAAVNLEPSNVDALLMLGHAREAKRTGRPVDAN